MASRAEVESVFQSHPDVAILMSGTGTNATAILENDLIHQHFNVAALVTDNTASNAAVLAEQHGIELIDEHVDGFGSLEERAEYFARLGDALEQRGVTGLVYAGFMRIASEEFCDRFPGVNMHPADLTITDESGLAVYRGMDAVGRMRSDLGFVRASVHVVQVPVDSGEVFFVTDPVYPDSDDQSDSDLHAKLRHIENATYPAALVGIAEGSL